MEEKILSETEESTKETRPWIRLFARMVDHLLYALFLLLFIFINDLHTEGFAMYILIFATIIFTDGLLLSRWGYTPGKYLFAIQVRKSNSLKLSFKEASKRTWGVLFEGLWLMIPIFSIIGGINSFVYLTHKGKTSWDEKGDFVIKKSRK